MGWSSSKVVTYNSSNNFARGRTVSQDRIDDLNANAPAAILSSNISSKLVKERIKSISNKSEEHANALIYVRSTFDTKYYTELFNNNFDKQLMDLYNEKSNQTFSYDVFHDVFMELVVNADIYAFCMTIYNEQNAVIMSSQFIWEEEKKMVDVKYYNILPKWLRFEKDNVFTIQNDYSLAEARRELISLGMCEKPEFLEEIKNE